MFAEEWHGRGDAESPGGTVGGSGVVAGQLVPAGPERFGSKGLSVFVLSFKSETSQTRAVPSSPPETTERPSGVKTTALTVPDPLHRRAHGRLQVPDADRLIVDRLPAPATRGQELAVGEKARPACSPWPSNVPTCLPEASSQRRIAGSNSTALCSHPGRPLRLLPAAGRRGRVPQLCCGSSSGRTIVPPCPRRISQMRIPSFSTVITCRASGVGRWGSSSP